MMVRVIPIFKRTLVSCECCGRTEVEPASVNICRRCDRMLTEAADYRMDHDIAQAKLPGWA